MNNGDKASFVLLLTESKTADYFSRIRLESEQRSGLLSEKWSINKTDEQESLRLSHADWPGFPLYIFAGRQIVTSERLEVLALATACKISDGLSTQEAIDAVHGQNGIAVLPWGAGKWLGARGEVIQKIIESGEAGSLFVGDNGGRPTFWAAPKQFDLAARRNIALLPGTDPLPLSGEDKRVGSYGASLEGEISEVTPAADFKRLLSTSGVDVKPFGARMNPFRFFKAQISLRLV
ncbi:hypothetical protein [Desulforhopalus sp. IMCC35007]|uniref:hypothetical protein n=1 Tax=Desulforhopalus sp. IMCC35007 TaxID=2569543 RepID=UPI0010ADC428|nr:hypothetical protein [Desulforhopalus sp. IMCC35007]TKB07610.1 hypothetical protein FCL48_16410 [Desulforhopalus sp. IMCC35007]